ncbi:abortive infection family protein [Desulfobacula sp.]|uniref:abortive infection family protein n=1 Tax=Desulfobacula sp. TaxID=2593537 RepID=UPI0025B82C67|nr:abortive infection family protein [Desulfobacula sp.]MBC2702933.1 abortive infection family protein [Desulfobacula sp.]
MEKLRDTISTYDAWEGLSTYINRIETFLESDFISSVENGKALIESICKTILSKTSEPYGETDSINKLVSRTLKHLGIFAENQISKFGSGMVTAMQNLGELRNNHGETSHGKSIDELKNNKLEKLSAAFLVNSIEVMAVFLIEYYEIEFPNKKNKKEEKIDYSEFNEFLDDEYGDVDVIGIPYPTSEVLLSVDTTAYGVKYQEYLGDLDETI